MPSVNHPLAAADASARMRLLDLGDGRSSGNALNNDQNSTSWFDVTSSPAAETTPTRPEVVRCPGR